MARNGKRLDEIGASLAGKHGIRVRVFPLDLSAPDAATKLTEALGREDIHIDFLINNAGFGTYGKFLNNHLNEEVNLNCVTLTLLCHILGKAMKEKGHGKIINVASIAGFQPGPIMAVYCATKAFVLSLSQALSAEFSLDKDSALKVCCLCPGATDTGFFDRSNNHNARFVKFARKASPLAVAQYGYRSLVLGDAVSVPGLDNKVLMLFTSLVPTKVATAVTLLFMSGGDKEEEKKKN